MKLSKSAAMLRIGRSDGNAMYPVLTWDDDHLVIIDTGLPGQIDEFVRAITDEGFSPESLTDIIITHQDMDHIGCAADLRKHAPSARVVAHAEEAPYLDGRKTPVKLQALLDNYDHLSDDQKRWCEQMKDGYASRIIPDIQTVADGDVLPVAGGIEVIHAPGHTPGHICLYLRDGGIMVGGDALNITDGHLTGPNPVYTQDVELGRLSLEKIKAHGMKAVVAYHGGFLQC